MVFKYIFSLIMIFFLSCSEIERDNILDPKNPDSRRDKMLLLEAFVNTDNPLPYNDYALQAIQTLSQDDDIRDRLIILEYHRDTQQYSDALEADSFNTESIYNNYMSFDANRFKGVPDLFINGARDRVQGASNASNVVNRLKDLAEEQLLSDGEYTIEVDFEMNGTDMEGSYRVARLGDQSSAATIMRMIITYESGSSGKHTVSRVTNAIAVAELGAGDYLEKDFVINNVTGAKAEKLIVVLWDNQDIHVLHAIEREIP